MTALHDLAPAAFKAWNEYDDWEAGSVSMSREKIGHWELAKDEVRLAARLTFDSPAQLNELIETLEVQDGARAIHARREEEWANYKTYGIAFTSIIRSLEYGGGLSHLKVQAYAQAVRAVYEVWDGVLYKDSFRFVYGIICLFGLLEEKGQHWRMPETSLFDIARIKGELGLVPATTGVSLERINGAVRVVTDEADARTRKILGLRPRFGMETPRHEFTWRLSAEQRASLEPSPTVEKCFVPVRDINHLSVEDLRRLLQAKIGFDRYKPAQEISSLIVHEARRTSTQSADCKDHRASIEIFEYGQLRGLNEGCQWDVLSEEKWTLFLPE